MITIIDYAVYGYPFVLLFHPQYFLIHLTQLPVDGLNIEGSVGKVGGFCCY